MSKLNDDTQKLYFIAIIPPAPVYEDAVSLKSYFKDNYNSKASLNSPPHITVHMPFRWKEKKESELIKTLGSFFTRFDPQKICLDNFGAFAPRVIFINVVLSEAIAAFQKEVHRFCRRELNLFNALYKEQPFHPHLTLAFRDLKKHAFVKAWEEFKDKEFKAEFIADRIALLKHNGNVWKVYKEFPLESSYTTENKSVLDTTEG